MLCERCEYLLVLPVHVEGVPICFFALILRHFSRGCTSTRVCARFAVRQQSTGTAQHPADGRRLAS